jgi:hypothetical protein
MSLPLGLNFEKHPGVNAVDQKFLTQLFQMETGTRNQGEGGEKGHLFYTRGMKMKTIRTSIISIYQQDLPETV